MRYLFLNQSTFNDLYLFVKELCVVFIPVIIIIKFVFPQNDLRHIDMK
jgi:hypothetical protein